MDQASNHGESVALAVAPDGAPHLAYNWADNPSDEASEFRYATQAGEQWRVETVTDTPGAPLEAAIWVDGTGAVQLAAIDAARAAREMTLLNRRRAGGGWIDEVIDGPFRGIAGLSLALDDDRAVHLAYVIEVVRGDEEFAELRHATNRSGAWLTETVAAGPTSGPSLALDAAGEPVIAFVAGRDGREVRIASPSGGAWSDSPITELGDDDLWGLWWCCTAIVVDEVGARHVFASGTIVAHATNAGGQWLPEKVPTPGRASPFGLAAVMDHDGLFHAAWFDQEAPHGAAVRYAVQVASGTTGSWAVEAVDEFAPVDGDLALVVGPDGRLHLAFTDGLEQVIHAVRDARCDGPDR